MMKPQFLMMGMLLVALAAPMATWACGAPESNVHAGALLGIDQDASTFTILDMQTGIPISFDADFEILTNLAGVQGLIRVVFEKRGDRLNAIEVNR